MILQLNQCAPAWVSSRLPTPTPGVCPPAPSAHSIRTSGPRGILFLQWVLGLGGRAAVFRIHLPPRSGGSALRGSVGNRSPTPKSGLPTVAQPRGLSRMGPPGLTAPAGLSWEPRQETGPAVGPGAGDRTVSAQGSRGLGSECHRAVEAPHHPQWSIHLILRTTP